MLPPGVNDMRSSVSGFPEWLPRQRRTELQFIKVLSDVAELYGFCSIETRAVERVQHLQSKGDTSKEIYTISRLQDADHATPATLGLHFDLTVPLARYVSEHKRELVFPFKRYQIQKVWRGERAQEGRYREFYQADFDVIANAGKRLLSYDSELLEMILVIFDRLPVPPIELRVNNRKLLQGLYEALDIAHPELVLRVMDKIGKVGANGVHDELIGSCGLSSDLAAKIVQYGQISCEAHELGTKIEELGLRNTHIDEGVSELSSMIEAVEPELRRRIVIDLGIVRGLSYYTGMICEGFLEGADNLGAICSGGRYDNLLETIGSNEKMPGVGLSIGLTRLLGHLFKADSFALGRDGIAEVLVALQSEADRPASASIAKQLRQRGIKCEIYHSADKFGKQIEYAVRKDIRYIWFPRQGDEVGTVKDLSTGIQSSADEQIWMPS